MVGFFAAIILSLCAYDMLSNAIDKQTADAFDDQVKRTRYCDTEDMPAYGMHSLTLYTLVMFLIRLPARICMHKCPQLHSTHGHTHMRARILSSALTQVAAQLSLPHFSS